MAAGWTIRNLREVEDMAPRFGLSAMGESRFARQELEAERIGASWFRLNPGVRQPFGHRHAEQEEVYVVLAGSGRVKLDDEIAEIRALDAIRVAPGTTRCFEAGRDGLEFLAVGTPGGANDVEMVHGWWAD
jgi:mannose-6-phosphate isomerase-like protein (cupin superfamily)